MSDLHPRPDIQSCNDGQPQPGSCTYMILRCFVASRVAAPHLLTATANKISPLTWLRISSSRRIVREVDRGMESNISRQIVTGSVLLPVGDRLKLTCGSYARNRLCLPRSLGQPGTRVRLQDATQMQSTQPPHPDSAVHLAAIRGCMQLDEALPSHSLFVVPCFCSDDIFRRILQPL